MIRGLDNKKYTPFFISAQEGPLIDCLKKEGVKILEEEVTSFSLKSPIKLLLGAFRLFRLLKSHKIHILHINEYSWNLDLSLAAWFARIPIISHIHNVTSIDKKNFVTYITNRFIFVSKNHMEHTKNIDLIEKKSIVIYNSIDCNYYTSGHNIREKLGYSQSDFIVGTIAQIAFHKGIDIIVEAAQICCNVNDNIKFVVVGPIAVKENEFASNIQKQIKAINCQDKINLVGPRKDIPDFLASIDLFFLPTRKETFGLVIGEALAAGVPVITSDVGGIPEIIKDNKNGYMAKTGDPTVYAQEILRQMNKKNNNLSLINIRKKHIRDNFSDEIIYRKLNHLYEELLN
jgi:glycosyltransferase involved in cell wall biosynthesis